MRELQEFNKKKLAERFPQAPVEDKEKVSEEDFEDDDEDSECPDFRCSTVNLVKPRKSTGILSTINKKGKNSIFPFSV